MAWNSGIAESLRGRRVLVTGHTGFKGAWLSLWLEALGAEVVGLSLPPEAGSLYERASLASRWPEFLSDIRGYSAVETAVVDGAPEIVFHLAAQPIVAAGYEDPIGTFETNTVGTMHVLEAARHAPSVHGCIVITTDKVYRPVHAIHRHVETDPLGAYDPYSASKAAAEHVINAWRGLLSRERGTSVVAVRAGNVIGGGDFAANRLLPDLVRAFTEGYVCEIRHPDFTRPWQHVLDPLSGYLAVGAAILEGRPIPEALNFGPDKEEPVELLADLAAGFWGDEASWVEIEGSAMPETRLLALDSGLASRSLGWRPTWTTQEAVGRTISWWKEHQKGADPVYLCLSDISDFMSQSDIA